MEFYSIVLVAFAIAFDAFAVSITGGAVNKYSFTKSFIMPISFGIFQSAMFVLGWHIGENISGFVSAIDHWIAFAILLCIGLKMIIEAIKSKSKKGISFESIYVLLVLSVATSIDAFAVGLSFSFLNMKFLLPSIIIGAITFFLCLIGVFVGKYLGKFFERKAKFVGGFILLGIGIKILIEHL